MKRTLALIGCAAVVMASLAGPALAGKKKPISDSFTVRLAPFPKVAAVGDEAGMKEPGCLAGQENVHWQSHEFTAPAAGTLTASMSGFTGDFDLYILDTAKNRTLPLASSMNDQIASQAPAEEEVVLAVTAKQVVNITTCNWLGAPDATVNFTFKFK